MHDQRWLNELARYLTSQIPGSPACASLPATTSPAAPLPPPDPELVAGLCARQLALNPAAAAWLARQGWSPRPVRSLAELPFIPVAAFKALELTTVPASERVAVFNSSGTTGPATSRHYHSRATLGIYELALEACFKRRVLGDQPWAWRTTEPAPSERPTMLSLTPPPADAPHSSLAFMIGRLRDRLGNTASSFQGRVGAAGWELDLPSARAALQAASRSGGPVVVLGTAFNWVHLLDDLASARCTVQLPPGSRVMETGGYKGRSREISKDALHQEIAARLGVPRPFILAEYGMSELSSQAYDADLTMAADASAGGGARRLQFPPWCHVTILSPETRRPVPRGQPGLLCVVDLANVASVLAVQTEDLAREGGNGFELLGRAAQAEARGCSLLASTAGAGR